MVGAEYQRNQRIDQNIVYPDLGPILRDRRSGYRAGVFVQDEWRLAACRTTPCKMPHRPRILRA